MTLTLDEMGAESELEFWRRKALERAQKNTALKEEVALLRRLVAERDDLADELADWSMAADRHGVPDELEDIPEAAFDWVRDHAAGELAKWEDEDA